MNPNGATLILSTRNAHKAQEIRALLSDRFAYLTLDDFPCAPRVTEDADTFAGNAAKKAAELAAWLAVPSHSAGRLDSEGSGRAALVLADDSGIEVDALGGAPGVHSARFAAAADGLKGNSSDGANNTKLLQLLREVAWEKRTARFRCVVALVAVPFHLPTDVTPTRVLGPTELSVEWFEGACEGRIGFAPKGLSGFGYDPLFIPDGLEQTFAELGEDTKNRISHRAQALAKLRRRLIGGNPPS